MPRRSDFGLRTTLRRTREKTINTLAISAGSAILRSGYSAFTLLLAAAGFSLIIEKRLDQRRVDIAGQHGDRSDPHRTVTTAIDWFKAIFPPFVARNARSGSPTTPRTELVVIISHPVPLLHHDGQDILQPRKTPFRFT